MKYSLLIMVFFCQALLIAQKQKTITLKNGNSYYGIIIPGDSGKIKLIGHDLNTYVFDTSEVSMLSNIKKQRFPSERMKSGTMHDLSFGISLINYYHSIIPYGIKVNYAFERVFNYRHSIGAEFILFVNDDFAPTIGLKYRYELLARPSTPFLSIGAGNYADPFWSANFGHRVNGAIGYQWGGAAYSRKYITFDISRTNGQFYGYNHAVEKYATTVFTFGMGWRL